MSLANVILCGLLLSAAPVMQPAATTGTKELRRYMESSDSDTRSYAALEYYHLGKETRRLTRNEIDLLVAHLKSDPEWDIKAKVTLALPYAENTEWVVGPLIAALKDRDEASSGGGNVPLYAAMALAKIGDARALKPLQEWLGYIESNPIAYRETRQLLIKGTKKAISELKGKIDKSQKAGRIAKTAFEQGVEAGNNGDLDTAINFFTEAIRLDPKNANAYGNRAGVYLKKREYDKAIADYTEAIRLNPKWAAVYCTARGYAYSCKGDHDKALADCTEAIRLAPKNAKVYSNRGVEYLSIGEYDKAIADCTEAIRLDPNHAAAYNNRGQAYRSKGENTKAEADFAEAGRLEGRAIAPYWVIWYEWGNTIR